MIDHIYSLSNLSMNQVYVRKQLATLLQLRTFIAITSISYLHKVLVIIINSNFSKFCLRKPNLTYPLQEEYTSLDYHSYIWCPKTYAAICQFYRFTRN